MSPVNGGDAAGADAVVTVTLGGGTISVTDRVARTQ